MAAESAARQRIDAIRDWVAANHLVRPKQVADALGYGIDQVRSSLDTLLRGGELKRVSYGLYEYVARRESAREAPIEDRIWRAMQINPRFAASDLAQQAGSTVSYIYKRMREYTAEGFIARAGRRPMICGGEEKLWRLSPKGRAHLERPRIEEYSPDPLVVAAVKLNKLVCTGMARRFPDARAEALRLCAEIARALGDGSDAAGIPAGEAGKGED